MPPNASSSSSADPRFQEARIAAEVDQQAHLECPRKVQAKISAERRALDSNDDDDHCSQDESKRTGTARFFNFPTEIKWGNALFLVGLHALGFYSFFTFPYVECWKTFTWSYIMGAIGGFGVTGGVHRYWTHRSYKANIPFRVLLMMCYCSAGQNSIYDWVRDHRVHHKYSETDADPHNSNRGFFFAHMGWLMMRKHPEVIRKGKEVDMSDVLADPVVRFAQKYFTELKLLLAFVLPVLVPMYFWNENWYTAVASQWFMRYMCSLNFTWSVNSAAHLWGKRPYNKNIAPVENKLVSFLSFGEGWHNYHHTFPWDYKAAELGSYDLNMTTAIIDFFALIGWVSDRKQPSSSLVRSVVRNRGDGSHENERAAH